MSQDTPTPSRGRILTALLRLLCAWGRGLRFRMALYALAMVATCIPPMLVYRHWMAWADNPFGPVSLANPGGMLIWFQIVDERLIDVDDPTTTPDAIGLDVRPSGARIDPPGKSLALSVNRIELRSAQWADPTRQPPPDLDKLARLLVAQHWADPGVEYTITTPAAGVYEARYCDPIATRAFARARAWPHVPVAGLRFLAAVLIGECLARIGRRVRLTRPGECLACGYPISDIPSPACPECGTLRVPELEPGEAI